MRANHSHYTTPFLLPVIAFLAAIGLGAFILSLECCAAGEAVSFVDSLFIATSAVCVTGLAPVDVFTVFNRAGQCVVLGLVQVGGIGIVTYTTLIFYLLGRRISLRERLAIEQGLFYDPGFNLGQFLKRMILMVFVCEAVGAAALFAFEPERVGLFNAVFIAVSALCNAGFAPWPDNLVAWQNSWAVTVPVMLLVIIGGIGFYVVDDVLRYLDRKLRGHAAGAAGAPAFHLGASVFSPPARLSYFSQVVLKTSAFLLAAGTAGILIAETGNPIWQHMALSERLLTALFQSVTARTAGFATMDMAHLSDVTLLITIMLMFIGGSPGSCAGGIKTTTFRVVCANLVSQLRGHSQIVVGDRAVDNPTRNKVLVLFYYALLIVLVATFALTITENGLADHGTAPISLMDLLFEVVSAFGTVGLSVNLTPHLSSAGKSILCLVMFIGKLGPVWLVTTIQQFQSEPDFRYPEDSMPIG